MITDTGSAVEQFVRGALGCSCPTEVFRSVSIDRVPAAVDRPSLTELRIGSRLLVRLTEMPGEPSSPDWLEQLAAEGCAARDSLGYNRFRLVLTSTTGLVPVAIADGLRARFAAATVRDDRAHLHVVNWSQLPAALSGATVAK
jgi:hypothetical protein